MISVCKNCPRKGCGAYHDVCPDYQADKAEHERIYKAKCEDNDARTYFIENSLRIRKAVMKKKYHSKGAKQ